MGAVAAKSLADLRHRRLQAAVLAVVLFLACGAATMALNILVASRAPFEEAFARANGAHLVIDYRASLGTAAVAATVAAERVTASAGPWPVTTGAVGRPGGGWINGSALSGRSDPLGPVDRITISAGRWWRTADEAVISWDASQVFGLRVGDRLAVYPDALDGGGSVGIGKGDGGGGGDRGDGGPEPVDRPGTPLARDPIATLAIVGIGQSVSTPDVTAWMSPTVLAGVAPDAERALEMLYRVEPATTPADITAATASITDSLPTDAVVGATNYLEARVEVDSTASLYVPVLLAFSVFALAAAAFTIANVVGGIVLTSYRQIGVMKAVGFTPRDVTTILEAQIMLPVALGAVAGSAVGTLASISTVERVTQSFGVPGAFSFSPVVLAAVLLVALGVSFLAALVPAIRAGRLRAATAISTGVAPSRRPDGGRLRRLGLRVPAPVAVRLGVAAGAAHPARASMTLGALLVGVAAATFAIGVNLSVTKAIAQIDRGEASPVRAEVAGQGVVPAAVGAWLAADPETDRFVAIGQTDAAVPLVGTVPFVGYDGDGGWIGFAMVEGRWFAGPGEVVATTNVIRRAGLAIGDTLEISAGGRTITVRLVGEVFDAAQESQENLVLRGSFADVAALDPAASPDRWEIRPVAGVSPDAYATRLYVQFDGAVGTYTLQDSSSDEEFLLFLSVVGGLGIVLVAVSLGGVFNTVLLETRHRTRELAVLKALGLAPREVVAMVLASVVPVGLVAGLLGVPLGLAFQRAVVTYMAETAAHTAVADVVFDVLPPIALVGLALAGLAIAAAGAYVPAQRAARARIAPVLQAE